ncbi:MAG: MXAN_6640 family putative metalloprotease, partial [bacterium]
PDTAFVRQLGEYLDRVWAFEIDTLGYPAPPSDRGLGGDNRYDVYIRSIDAYGVTWQESEGPEPWDDYISYIEINNDFSAFPPNTDPDGHTSGALKVTSAHEFFHAIQMGINADTDGWWMEMTAVWMEETAYDTVNDYYNYLRDFFGSPEVSLIAYDGSHEYGAGLFPLYLSTKWGVNIIRSIWSNCKWHSAFEAISLTLDSIGTTIDEAVLEFFVWNYFTSIRDDGHHYPEGSSYPGVRFESVHATYPASGSSRHQPQGLGTNYIMFRPGSATGTLHISANCIPGVKWGLSFLRLQSSGESSFSTIILPSGGTTSFNVSPVERYSTIVVILSPLGGSSTSTYNFSYSAILTGELYPPPINLRASSGYDHMVPLMWQPRSGFLPTRYSVYRKLAGESNFIRIAATPETSYNDSSVENGRTYVYAVTAIYDTIESVFSDTVWAIPGGGVVIDSVWLRR